jgi:hypothetical protein
MKIFAFRFSFFNKNIIAAFWLDFFVTFFIKKKS